MQTFLVATGSWLERAEVAAAIGPAPEQFDRVVTTPYGFSKAPEKIRSRAIVYVNPFAHSSPDTGDDDWYPGPVDMARNPRKIQWDPNNPDHVAWGYRFTREWAHFFAGNVAGTMAAAQPAGVLLDDWHPNHKWWTCSDEDWEWIHGAGTEQERLEWLTEIETLLHAMGVLKFRDAVILTNGVSRVQRSRRYWEGVYQPWRPEDIPRRYGLSGDLLYCNTGEPFDWRKTVQLGRELKMSVGWGFPDGESLVDGTGALRIPSPVDLGVR